MRELIHSNRVIDQSIIMNLKFSVIAGLGIAGKGAEKKQGSYQLWHIHTFKIQQRLKFHKRVAAILKKS
jgi:hypothetical protein